MKSNMEIKSLHDTSFGILSKAFSQAFASYETQVNELQSQVMLARQGYPPELSFGAFDEDELVATSGFEVKWAFHYYIQANEEDFVENQLAGYCIFEPVSGEINARTTMLKQILNKQFAKAVRNITKE